MTVIQLLDACDQQTNKGSALLRTFALQNAINCKAAV
jgi:hypothetical protein